jgi:hypothetical protein
MYIEPIEIDIDDNKTYAQIAYLLDGTRIVKEILEIRRVFKVGKPLNPDDLNAWKYHCLKLAGYNLEKYEAMKKIHAGDPKLSDDDWEKIRQWTKDNENKFLEYSKIQQRFWGSVADIRRSHHYPHVFDHVIGQVILYNRVLDFKTAYARLTHGSENDLLTAKNDDIVHSIILTPYSTTEDVLTAYEQIKSEELKKEAELTDRPFSPKLDADTRNKIKNFRKWYWMNHRNNPNKIGYRKLAQLTGINMQTIRSGIRAYSDFISFET